VATEAPTTQALPPEPQEIEFQADDGQSLQGRYYPAAVNPAPLVVLMHWAPGDQNEWNAIAPWLQNRGQTGGRSNGAPWLDLSWFPPMPEGQSFGVFTFTFRNCEGGCKSFTRDAWLLDAQAAMRKARQLEGIDPKHIVAIGASIGADGAPDSCGWLNSQFPNSCLGALSLSPGDYLTVAYKEAVSALGAEQPPKPAWCLYAEGDAESARACEAAAGDNYRAIKYPGNNHGMMLIRPDVEPGALELILDFLKLSFDL
jgi:dienelactone hydrolase